MYILTQLLIAMSITLIGFMGCGKSTIGHLLSQRINKKFIDLDEYISAKQQMKLSEIFKKMGEDAFREIEHICLKEVLKEEYAVISLGGGTPCFFNNMDLITQASFSIYIKMDADVLAKRLLFSTTKRPLIQDKNKQELRSFIQTTLEKREVFYNRASYTLINNSKTAIEATTEILHVIHQHKHTE